MTITIRPARRDDCEAIIGIHVEMSRQAYGHILDAQYLREVLPAEKTALWSARFSAPIDPEKLAIMVAETDGEVVGFASAVFDPADKWGVYLHHLYVTSAFQRRGLARRLWLSVLDAFPPAFENAPISLIALEGNMPARGLYERVGGKASEHILIQYPGNPNTPALRYTWPDRDKLRDAIAAG